ncbi:MAG TPA: hypothetical protein VLY46_12220 [Usitatibacter sp.]|nr:hypothetical protein [Usitatibacter sp.]
MKAIPFAVGALLAAILLVPAAAMAERVPSACDTAAANLPQRAPSTPRGSEFAHGVAGSSGPQRDAEVVRDLLAGDVPRFLRHLVPVVMSGRTADGSPAEVTLCVMPDYLSVGNQDDFVRVPMGLSAALTVADAYGFMLPTRRMVDAIYRQAQVRLAPQPLPPGDAMRSTSYLVRHNEMIDAQRAATGAPLEALTAGDKKDLVLTKLLWSTPGRVAIYGWHRLSGVPVQPLSIVHGARYADYSHGVRLVSSTAFVNGRARSLLDLLGDARYAPLLSDEGPLHDLRERLRSLAAQAAVLAALPAVH